MFCPNFVYGCRHTINFCSFRLVVFLNSLFASRHCLQMASFYWGNVEKCRILQKARKNYVEDWGFRKSACQSLDAAHQHVVGRTHSTLRIKSAPTCDGAAESTSSASTNRLRQNEWLWFRLSGSLTCQVNRRSEQFSRPSLPFPGLFQQYARNTCKGHPRHLQMLLVRQSLTCLVRRSQVKLLMRKKAMWRRLVHFLQPINQPFYPIHE